MKPKILCEKQNIKPDIRNKKRKEKFCFPRIWSICYLKLIDRRKNKFTWICPKILGLAHLCATGRR